MGDATPSQVCERDISPILRLFFFLTFLFLFPPFLCAFSFGMWKDCFLLVSFSKRLSSDKRCDAKLNILRYTWVHAKPSSEKKGSNVRQKYRRI